MYKNLIHYLGIILILISFSGCPKNPNTGPIVGKTPVPPQIKQLVVGVRGNKITFNGKETFIRGYSMYGAFFNQINYEDYFKKLSEQGINWRRDWTSPIPEKWYVPGDKNALYPFGKKPDGKYDLTKLNADFVKHLHEVLYAGEKYGIGFHISLSDKVMTKYPDDFAGCPLNEKLGGFIKPNSNGTGFPDFWDPKHDDQWKSFVKLYMDELYKHKNIVVELTNEPEVGRDFKFGTPDQITRWNNVLTKYIRDNYPGTIIMVSPQKLDNYQLVPDISGSDIVDAHGLVWLPNLPKTEPCYDSSYIVNKLNEALTKVQNKPFLMDTDGLAFKPCDRDDNKILQEWRNTANVTNVAGFVHRDMDIAPGTDTPDWEAVKIVGSSTAGPIKTPTPKPTEPPSNLPSMPPTKVSSVEYKLMDGLSVDAVVFGKDVIAIYTDGSSITKYTYDLYTGNLKKKDVINNRIVGPLKYNLAKTNGDTLLYKSSLNMLADGKKLAEGNYETYDVKNNYMVLTGTDPIGSFYYFYEEGSWRSQGVFNKKPLYPFSMLEYKNNLYIGERDKVIVLPSGKILNFGQVNATSNDIMSFTIVDDIVYAASQYWKKYPDNSWKPTGIVNFYTGNINGTSFTKKEIITLDTSGLANNTSLMPQVFNSDNKIYLTTSVKNVTTVWEYKNGNLSPIWKDIPGGQPKVVCKDKDVWLFTLSGVFHGRF